MKLGYAFLSAVAVALVIAAPASAFTVPNTYYAKQWYLAQDNAFAAWGTQSQPPQLTPVKVAVVDSGVDCSLPDFAGATKIVAERSFVGGNACVDNDGHGTIVAGEIAGDLGTNGVVGVDFSAQLVVAKVVTSNGAIPLKAEAAAIRWAADQGARVINLSLGGVRDPADPAKDTYSTLEAKAVAYAFGKGAVVVAAAGNSDEAYATPWRYASWPAALPHVIGVGALTKAGNVPDFSDRDPVFVDMSAPGVDIFSTFPAKLTAEQTGCTPQGYTDCASGEYVHPEGTSFAAPQVSAAAAVLFGVDPGLTNSQVSTILERQADDVNPTDGCTQCSVGRDEYSGWGRLDVQRAVDQVTAGDLPAPDRFEPNDDVAEAHTVWGAKQTISATLDYYDDPVDVYKVKLGVGRQLKVRATATWHSARIGLILWRPGTRTVFHGSSRSQRAAQSVGPGAVQHVVYRASKSGWYYVEVHASRPGAGAYTLKLTKVVS